MNSITKSVIAACLALVAGTVTCAAAEQRDTTAAFQQPSGRQNVTVNNNHRPSGQQNENINQNPRPSGRRNVNVTNNH